MPPESLPGFGGIKMEHAKFVDWEWLVGVVILSLTFLMALAFPITGTFVLIFAPGITAYYLARLGRLKGTLVLVVSLLIGEGVGKTMGIADTLFLSILGVMGVILYEMLKKNFAIEKTILGTTGITLAVILCVIAVESIFSNLSPDTIIMRYITDNITESLRISQHMVPESEKLAQLRENLPVISRWIMYLAPALLGVGIAFIIWVDIILLRPIFALRGLAFPSLGNLTTWKAPEGIVWVLIASGFLVLILPLVGIKETCTMVIGMNGLIVSLFVYFLQGVAVVEYFFRSRSVPQIFRMIFYLLLVLQQYLVLIVALMGLFDLWIDWRKPRKEKDSEED